MIVCPWRDANLAMGPDRMAATESPKMIRDWKRMRRYFFAERDLKFKNQRT
jgi:hypothetical protein